jgi:hypothetical protein
LLRVAVVVVVVVDAVILEGSIAAALPTYEADGRKDAGDERDAAHDAADDGTDGD